MILDCTLRDGGFINNWEFGYSSIRSVVSRLDRAGIEIIEVGYLNAKHEYDKNRTMFPDTESINLTLSGLSVSQAMLVAITDFGTCPLENIAPRSESIIDGIRTTFKKNEIDAALEFCTQLKKKGYKIFLNPVSLTSYTDKEILELFEKINVVEPYAVSIVDTYGLMLRDEILHYIDLIDNNLTSGVKLGYHSHNNQQMAYANCSTFLDRRNRHSIIIDTSLFGMGKSAGNANTELVASYANKVHNKNYKTEQLLDCIYTDIMRIYKKTPWGYNLHHYLSALNDCHHDYIGFLLKKNTLSVQGIDEIVAQIPQEQKLIYSHTLIEKLYIEYQNISINDTKVCDELKNVLNDNTILLILPGNTVKTHEAEINKYIEKNNPILISVNFLPSYISPDYVFTGNRKRYDKLVDFYFTYKNSPKIIATSNILESNIPITYKLNYESLIESEFEIIDNSSVLCLNFLKKLNIKKVAIAGMDGFSIDAEKNFADPFMDMCISMEDLTSSNVEMKKFIDAMRENMALDFITPSFFDEKEK